MVGRVAKEALVTTAESIPSKGVFVVDRFVEVIVFCQHSERGGIDQFFVSPRVMFLYLLGSL